MCLSASCWLVFLRWLGAGGVLIEISHESLTGVFLTVDVGRTNPFSGVLGMVYYMRVQSRRSRLPLLISATALGSEDEGFGRDLVAVILRDAHRMRRRR